MAVKRFDVRDYGAKCDTLHDDAHALNAALQAAYDVGGGIVFGPNVASPPSDGCRTCHRPWTECEC